MIELQRVTKCYGTHTIVDAVDLCVRSGETLVLLGGSGSGKTTTLKMINRLVAATSGSVRVDGSDVTEIEPHRLRRQVGYVFQQLGLFPHMSIAENIGVTPRLLGWSAASIRERVDELLKLVELDAEVGTRKPHQLSGGQQQRVAVARALAARPKVLLLDEPFAALDPLTRGRLQSSFARIRDELGFTAVFVTHDVIEAMRLGHRIAVMHAGKLVQMTTPDALLHDGEHPYLAEMIGAVTQQANDLNAWLGSHD